MSERNKAIIRRIFEQVWNHGNLTIIDERVSNDYLGHLGGDSHRGPEGIKEHVPAFLYAFPDYPITIEDQVAEGDKVVTRWTAQGTHHGTFRGILATGKRVTTGGVAIHRFAHGELAEGWAYVDMLGLLEQLGAVPGPGQEGNE
jgi:steroid delta-isomerase-like uncharacterized protein